VFRMVRRGVECRGHPCDAPGILQGSWSHSQLPPPWKLSLSGDPRRPNLSLPRSLCGRVTMGAPVCRRQHGPQIDKKNHNRDTIQLFTRKTSNYCIDNFFANSIIEETSLKPTLYFRCFWKMLSPSLSVTPPPRRAPQPPAAGGGPGAPWSAPCRPPETVPRLRSYKIAKHSKPHHQF